MNVVIDFLKRRVVVFASLFLLVLVYSGSFLNDFAVHNDYRARDHLNYTFDTTSLEGMLQHDESMHLLYIGRPLNAILFNYQQSKLKSIEDFAIARFISFVTLLILCTVIYVYFNKRYKINCSYLFLILIGTLLLPSSALYINWESNYIPGPFNLMLALISWMLFDLGQNSKNTLVMLLLFIATYILLLCSCMIYPATTFFFLFAPFLRIFFDKSDWHDVRRQILIAIVFIIVVMLSYYFLHKKILFPYFQDVLGSRFVSYDASTYKFKFSLNTHFFKLLMESIFSGLDLFSTKLSASIFFILNLFAVISAFFVSYLLPPVGSTLLQSDKNKIVTQKVVFSILLIGLTLTPILLSTNGFVAYRILFVFYVMCLVLCVYSYSVIFMVIRMYMQVNKQKLILVMATVFFGYGLANNIAIVNNSKVEYDFFKNRLSLLPQIIKKSTDFPVNIYVALPERYKPFVNYDLPYDLVYTATNYAGLMTSIIYLINDSEFISRDKYRVSPLNIVYRKNYEPPSEILNCSNCLVITPKDVQR